MEGRGKTWERYLEFKDLIMTIMIFVHKIIHLQMVDFLSFIRDSEYIWIV